MSARARNDCKKCPAEQTSNGNSIGLTGVWGILRNHLVGFQLQEPHRTVPTLKSGTLNADTLRDILRPLSHQKLSCLKSGVNNSSAVSLPINRE